MFIYLIQHTVTHTVENHHSELKAQAIMNSTSELAYEFDYRLKSPSLFEEIENWMESNTFYSDQGYVWQVGVSTGPILKGIKNRVLRDIECKHFKCWQADSFKKAIGILSRLNKQNLVFKSELNDYTEKGQHIFIYKTSFRKKRLFYHTLHH